MGRYTYINIFFKFNLKFVYIKINIGKMKDYFFKQEIKM